MILHCAPAEKPHVTLLRHIAEVAKVETFYATDPRLHVGGEVSVVVEKVDSRGLRTMAVLMDATTVIDERTTITP